MDRSRSETYLLGENLPSPLILGSGTIGESYERLIRCLDAGAAAVCTRSLRTDNKREFPTPRYVIRPGKGYMLNCEIGNETPWEYWQENIGRVKEHGRIILALSARNPAGAKTIVDWFQDHNPPFCYEVNFSCPHSAKMHGSIDHERVSEIIEYIHQRGAKSVVKFSLDNFGVGLMKEFEQYADGFVLSNSIGPGVEIDHETGRPLLGSGYGGLSGPALKPLVMARVIEMRRHTEKDVIAVGGIDTHEDVIQYIRAGANAAQVYTRAHIDGPQVFGEMRDDLEEWLGKKGLNIDQLRGSSLRFFNSPANYDHYTIERDDAKCSDCGDCETVCLTGAIKDSIIDANLCNSCGACVTLCPTGSMRFSDWNDER